MIRETLIAVRKSTDHAFNSFATLGEYANQLNQLNCTFLVTYSDDELTRTRVMTYTAEQKKQLDALQEKYATEIATETARQQALGIVETTIIEILE
jgi:hypothetical protein